MLIDVVQHNRLDKSTSSSGAAAASKSSKVPHCYSDDEDRWCPTAEDGPVVFSSLVDPEIEAANAKRRQLKVQYWRGIEYWTSQ